MKYTRQEILSKCQERFSDIKTLNRKYHGIFSQKVNCAKYKNRVLRNE